MSAASPPGQDQLRAADVLRRPLRSRGGVAGLCSDLVRIPSPSGGEELAVRRVVEEMKDLGFDEAHVDATGNAVGIVRASGSARRRERCLLLNSHLDVVDPGDPAAWTRGPYSADVHEGRLFGRGSSDA